MNKPEKPNITIPESFAVNGVKADFDNNKILNGFDRIQPDVLAGDNLNKFIDDTYKGLNYALNFGDYIDTKADKADLDAKVNKSGDTMTGNLTISTADTGYLQYVKTSINFGNAPTSQQNIGGFRCYAGSALGSNITAIVQGYISSINEKSSHGIQFVTRKPDNSAWGAQMRLESLADGQALFEFPKCTTKATTTSSAANNKVAVIVQNYVNGASWYRVWSDGWIEQGGDTRIGTGDTTITFLKSFSNASYTFTCTPISPDGYYTTVTIKSLTAQNIVVYLHQSNFAKNSRWYACGY